ncbi:MAG: hypothetical protein DRN66_04275 [Candidatus Nanohalarchaeota archaeon]|nr:MAG: hypothetical protein DRN66_04275 [Candidatus Nanohaloarchaeota archaeon]
MDDIKKEFEEVKKSTESVAVPEATEPPEVKKEEKVDREKKTEQKEKTNYRKEFPEAKLTLLWIIGSLFIFIGSWFAGHLRENIGLSGFAYAAIIVVSFLFILLGGFMWITIAVIICHEELE